MLFANNSNNNNNGIGIFIVLGIILLTIGIVCLIIWYRSKRYKRCAINFISGSPKTGKTGLMLALGLTDYFTSVFRYYFDKFLLKELIYFTFHRNRKLIFKYNTMVKPILITNMPIRYIKYVSFTIDIIDMVERIPPHSVVLFDEISIFIDSTDFKDKRKNAKLMYFFKVFGHHSHMSRMYINSQSPLDMHYSIKRVISRYLYIHNCYKYPFLVRFKVKEMAFSEDGNQYQMNSNDFEKSGFLNIFAPSLLFKIYDPCYLSGLTDHLPLVKNLPLLKKKHDSLKARELLTMNKDIKEYIEK